AVPDLAATAARHGRPVVTASTVGKDRDGSAQTKPECSHKGCSDFHEPLPPCLPVGLQPTDLFRGEGRDPVCHAQRPAPVWQNNRIERVDMSNVSVHQQRRVSCTCQSGGEPVTYLSPDIIPDDSRRPATGLTATRLLERVPAYFTPRAPARVRDSPARSAPPGRAAPRQL